MPRHTFESDEVGGLGRLLSLAGSAPTHWPATDLVAIWRHQLSAPLLLDLEDSSPDATRTINAIRANPTRSLERFEQLLADPNPPPELLQMIKEFAKQKRSHADAAFPEEVATVLYYSSIALALMRCDVRITGMNDWILVEGFQWCVGQTWLDDQTLTLLRDALSRLKEQLISSR